MSGKPFKMKYTNGKKADTSSFPFKTDESKPGDSPADFSWKAALSGAVKGGTAGSMVGPWGTVLGGIGGGLVAGFSGDDDEEGPEEGKNKELISKLSEEDKKTAEVEKMMANRSTKSRGSMDQYTGL